MKQTVEEAARKYSNDQRNRQHHCEPYCIVDFKVGVEWQSKQSPWISVEESLPKNDENHFFINCRSNAVGTAYYEDGNWYSSYSGEVIYGITHYMPIPSFNEILEANRDVL